MTTNEKKTYIKSMNKAAMVKELVEGLDMCVDDAVSYVYDTLTLTEQEFIAKYF